MSSCDVPPNMWKWSLTCQPDILKHICINVLYECVFMLFTDVGTFIFTLNIGVFKKRISNQYKFRPSELSNRLGIPLLFVFDLNSPFTLVLSGGPKWPENSCVCLDPQLPLCPDIFISVAYLWQQCMCKGPSGPKWQTDYMTSRLLSLLLIFYCIQVTVYSTI